MVILEICLIVALAAHGQTARCPAPISTPATETSSSTTYLLTSTFTSTITTTQQPNTSTVTSTTTQEPTTSTVTSTTTQEPSSSTVPSTTTQEPASSTVMSTTTQEPSTLTVTSTTTQEPSSLTITSTTTQEPTTSTVTSTTTMEPSTSTVTSTTTQEPSTPTVTSTTTQEPTTSSVTSTTTQEPTTSDPYPERSNCTCAADIPVIQLTSSDGMYNDTFWSEQSAVIAANWDSSYTTVVKIVNQLSNTSCSNQIQCSYQKGNGFEYVQGNLFVGYENGTYIQYVDNLDGNTTWPSVYCNAANHWTYEGALVVSAGCISVIYWP
ncbi:unnamed protein product [Caenorhabditis sp. 36 PRJEB53466]|nr:unnamed protein product [Caenorhabditis sp. 36 PRJEB53466]